MKATAAMRSHRPQTLAEASDGTAAQAGRRR